MKKPILSAFLIVLLISIQGCKSQKSSKNEQNETTLSAKGTGHADPHSEEDAKPTYDRITDYRASRTKNNELINTKLEVSFDWEKKQMLGKAWLTLKPYFYDTDSLVLDAKSMDIKRVEMVSDDNIQALNYRYDSAKIYIKLNQVFTRKNKYQVLIEYVARPESHKAKGSDAISSDKGLFFINADGKDPKKPKQIWTQGETEASSVWFPTIDAPNQKTSQDIYITVDTSMVTLSNGQLIYSMQNKNGTKTDYWKQTLPHSPYLFMMAVGNFSIIKDKWRGKEVNYYVEPKYAAHAKAIFGKTPEMIEFFSKKLGVDYPWDKYSQVVVRDYVSGAMENTGAVVFGDFAQKTTRELLDGDPENVISHELFHHWFGDLVTAESWSNLSLNESFATYGEYLWNEYKYGRFDADYDFNYTLNGYLGQAKYGEPKHLIRFYYDDKEAMFDGISYSKGGRILHMLRKEIGDDAFFEGLKMYLTRFKHKSAEAHDLRLVFEEITGRDLNLFFNQWYFGGGHPQLNVSYNWSDSTRIMTVNFEQVQKASKDVPEAFQIPMYVDFYTVGEGVKREKIEINKRTQSFSYRFEQKPLLVNIDAEKTLVCEKKDPKGLEECLVQWKLAPLFLDKYEALDFLRKSKSQDAKNAVFEALSHTFWGIRLQALKGYKFEGWMTDEAFVNQLVMMAKTDSKASVRVEAVRRLSEIKRPEFVQTLFSILQKDSSYAVMGSCITAISNIDSNQAQRLISEYKNETFVQNSILEVVKKRGTLNDDAIFLQAYNDGETNQKMSVINNYADYLLRFGDKEVEKGIQFYTNIAKNGDPWWHRYYAYQKLDDFNMYYTDKINMLKAKVNDASKSDLEKVGFAKNISQLKKAQEELANAKKEIASLETNEQLKKIYNGK